MLKYPEEYREWLNLVLKEYKAVLPTELPKVVQPNHRIRDEIQITL